jgi:GT2 family glycosyltransferase
MDKLISFCVNTSRNELNHIKLLFKSLEKNLSTLEHEIIVFVDSDNQGTTEWLLNQKQIFPNLKILKNKLPIPYGYQRNINEMFEYATHEIISYLQSDMVVCKNYDIEVLKYLEPNMILCSTRIEPPLHGNSGEKITYDFGLYPENFDLEKFTQYAEEQKLKKFIKYFFAPFTMYKNVWNDIGGHDTMFRRSREDSDVLNRLTLSGVNIIQTWEALVYHFTCTSSRGVDWFNSNNKAASDRAILQKQADSVEMKRFVKKWGIFNHGNPVNYFYNINAKIIIDVNNYELLETIEPFFNEIYISNKKIIKNLPNTQYIANLLLGIEENTWEKYSYMYQNCNLQKYVDNILSNDIVIEFKLSGIDNNNFYSFINNLQHIIHQTEDLGVFEYENFKITINKKENLILNKIKIKNPEIKPEDKYLIL